METRNLDYRTTGPERCHLGEGPTYDPHSDIAWWFDILERKLLEHHVTSGETRVHDLPFMASALARIDAGRQLLSTEDGLFVRHVGSGEVSLLAPIEADNAATRSNDARVHPSGAFWIGTMGRNAEADAGSIHWFFKGETRTLFTGITVTNTISFTSDGAGAYFADSEARQIMRVAVDPATGLPNDTPRAFDDMSGLGVPDGAVVDADDVLWVARWGGGVLEAYRPDATLQTRMSLPVSQPTCPAFVGGDGSNLLVTSAFADFDDAQKQAEPLAGATFILDLGLNGRFEPDVIIE